MTRWIVTSMLLLLLPSVAFAGTSAVISWSTPTQYEDGSTLAPSDILTYTVYYGTSSGNYTKQVTVAPPNTSVTISGLSGTYYFAASTTTTEMEESALSSEISGRFTKGKPKKLVISIGNN